MRKVVVAFAMIFVCLSIARASDPARPSVVQGSAVAIDGIDPKMQWFPVPPAPAGFVLTYRIQIGLDTNFVTPFMDSSGVVDTFYNTTKALAYLTKYYWRVNAAYSKQGQPVTSPWSAIWNFTTVGPAAPPPPVLTYPPNGSTSISMNFKWQPVQEASSYTLQVARDRNFRQMVGSVTNTIDTSGTLKLASCTTYWCRIRSNRGSVSSVWSTSWFRA
jgi:hypothetical protein